jgi:Replication-relaxation
VSAIPDSYTAVHRYDGAIIQRQRCDDPDPVALRQRDLGIVRDVCRYHFLTTDQIRELWWPGKSPQAARRRLVKLFRGGYMERFRPYSPRGSFEWTYYLAAAGHRLLRTVGIIDPDARFKPRDVFDYGRALHDVQVNAWVLAYRRLLGPALLDWQGEHQLTPPRGTRNGQRTLDQGWSIEGLRDPQPRPVVPDAALRIADDSGKGARSFLLEYDRTTRTDKNFDKFRRYDNLVTSWWCETKLAEHSDAPYVLFICQDEGQRDDFLARADQELTGHRWHPNHPAAPHQYTGRRQILFCDERDIHHRHTEARRLPPYPPGHPARQGSDAEIRGVRLPAGAPNPARVAAPSPEGNGVAEPVAGRTGANATLVSGIREAAPGNAEDLRRTQAETERRRPGAAALEGIPVPATRPFERADTAV